MGKYRKFWVRFAAALDRGRLGAITLLMIEAVVVSSLLSPADIQPPAPSSSQGSAFVIDVPQIRFAPAEDNSSPTRNSYPYSVIPGGATSAGELRNAVANDSTVRAHYADFVLANTRVERLKTAKAFYVSYRIGNNIFWTRKALTIRAGETVLSDGTSLARTRCGNRLSAVPVAPVSKIEPAPEAMESPAGEPLLATIAAPAELPVAPLATTQIATPPPIPAAPPVGIFLPLPPYIPVGFGGPSTSGTPATPPPGPPTTPPSSPPAGPPATPPGTPPGTPPVPAPEPSEFLMIAAGLACVLLWSKLR